MCLFCSQKFVGGREACIEFFRHMNNTHQFNIGHPDNMVRPLWPSSLTVRLDPLTRFLGFCERIYWNFTIAVERSPVSELCKNIQRSQYAKRSYEKEIASRTEQRRSIIWQILSYKLSWNGQKMDTGISHNQIISTGLESGLRANERPSKTNSQFPYSTNSMLSKLAQMFATSSGVLFWAFSVLVKKLQLIVCEKSIIFFKFWS